MLRLFGFIQVQGAPGGPQEAPEGAPGGPQKGPQEGPRRANFMSRVCRAMSRGSSVCKKPMIWNVHFSHSKDGRDIKVSISCGSGAYVAEPCRPHSLILKSANSSNGRDIK